MNLPNGRDAFGGGQNQSSADGSQLIHAGQDEINPTTAFDHFELFTQSIWVRRNPADKLLAT